MYAALVHERIHFAQAAYRDGEWACMLAWKRGRNVNGEPYDPALGALLRDTLLRPVGQWCVYWPGDAGPALRSAADRWLAEHRPDVRWLPDRPLARASIAGLLSPFWRAAATRDVLVVGPPHTTRMPAAVLAGYRHIEVPADGTAWRHVDRLCDEIRARLVGDDLVLICAGMAANLIVHRLWPELRGRATLYDAGSMLDPYCGVFSRRLYQDSKWQRTVLPRNYP